MMNRRRFLGAGLGAAVAAPLVGTYARADEGRRVLTASDVHVKDYPTVEAVRWIGDAMARTRERVGDPARVERVMRRAIDGA